LHKGRLRKWRARVTDVCGAGKQLFHRERHGGRTLHSGLTMAGPRSCRGSPCDVATVSILSASALFKAEYWSRGEQR
jgi:lysozyme family protein